MLYSAEEFINWLEPPMCFRPVVDPERFFFESVLWGTPEDLIPGHLKVAEDFARLLEMPNKKVSCQENLRRLSPGKGQSKRTDNRITLPFASRFQKQFDGEMKTLATGFYSAKKASLALRVAFHKISGQEMAEREYPFPGCRRYDGPA